MISNEKRSQAWTQMVVAKDTLKTEINKSFLFAEQKEQNIEYLSQTA